MQGLAENQRSALSILLIEDSRADARLIEIALRGTSQAVALTTVTSLQTAVHALTDASFDLALLDLGLPDGVGLQNVQRLHSLAPQLPIIILTGLDDERTASGARAQGALGYVVKGDFTGEELLARIRASLPESDGGQAVADQPAADGEAEANGIETDARGRITAWGPDAEEVTGFGRDEMLGEPIASLVPAERADEIPLLDGRIQRGESVRDFETLRRHRDGGLREVNLTLHPRRDASGAITGGRCLMRDITELKRDRADAMQLAAIVASTADAIIAITLDGAITHWNPGAERLLGYAAADMTGASFDMLLPDTGSPQVQRVIERARQGQTVPRFDSELRHSDGHRVQVSITCSPIRDRTGGLAGAAILASDISERKAFEYALQREIAERENANAELQQTLQQLRETQGQLVQAEKLASLGALVAGVAHEINTPVGVGMTAASHLRGRLQDARQQYQAGTLRRSDFERLLATAEQSAEILLTNLTRATELVASFKQVAVDQTSREMRRFNVATYIDEILTSLKPKLRGTAVEVTVDCPEGLVLTSVPGALSQIITNLVVNSLTHGFEPGGPGRITIRARQSDGRFLLTYEDDGKGMDETVRERLFDPFFTTNRSLGGTGLGMHVVYNLITRKLGGQVTVASAPGQGMRLSISLPLRERET